MQFLSLRGCYGSQIDMVEKKNEKEWKISEIVLPPPKGMDRAHDSAIEIDPEYLLQNDDEF